MLTLSTILATCLYLLPVLLLVLCRLRKDMDAAELATLVSVAVALDLLATLVLTRAMRLELAVVLVRALWVVVGGGYLFFRWKRARLVPALPEWVTRRVVLEVLVAAAAALVLSLVFTTDCHNADRGWHIPLTTSLAGQALPFRNVYDPSRPLGYHFTGNVIGVMLQTLSGMRMHSSLALSVGHDIMFALAGGVMALIVRSFGYRGFIVAALSGLALLLAGPQTVLHHDPALVSYSYVCFYRISFRPHTSLAAVLVAGLCGAVLTRIRGVGSAPTFAAGVAILIGAMAVTDEATIALLGLSLGCAWLCFPRYLGEKWWHGAAWLAVFLVALIVPQVIFSGSLSSGAPKHVFSLVAPRAPGYLHTPIPLSFKNARGLWAMFYDVSPQVLLWLAGTWVLLRSRTRDALAVWSFGGAALLVGYFLLTQANLDDMPVENHRFWTAPMLALPILGLYWIKQARDLFPKILVAVALSAAAISSLVWVGTGKSSFCTRPSRYRSAYDFYKVDCRKDTGATLAEKVDPTYLEAGAAYLYAGCHPTFTAGPSHIVWKETPIGAAESGVKALADIHEHMLDRDATLTVICLIKKTDDPVCAAAREIGACAPEGREIQRCELPATGRAALLSKLR